MARLKTIAFHVLPFIAGAVVITAFGVGLTKYKNSPLDYRYSLLEMDLMPRSFALLGLVLLGSGIGGLLISFLSKFADGEFEATPEDKVNYLWNSSALIGSLFVAGVCLLGIGLYVLN